MVCVLHTVDKGGGGGGGCIIKMGRVYNHFLLEIRMATYVCQVLHLPPIVLCFV